MLEISRLGWFTGAADGREIVTHSGATRGFASFAGCDCNARVGVVVLSNACARGGVDDIGVHLLNPKAAIANPEAPKERAAIRIDPEILDQYIGRYQVTPNLIFEITRDGGRLFAQGFTGVGPLPRFELFAEGENQFFARVSESRITFEADANGDARGLILNRAGRAIWRRRDCRELVAEVGQGNDLSALHRGFVGADPGAGPVDGLVDVREGRPVFNDARDEFVDEVWVRATVSAALREGEVRVLFVVNAFGGEALNFFREQAGVIGDRDFFRRLAAVKDRLLILHERPLKRGLAAVDVDTLDVLARGFKQRARDFERELLIADLEERTFDRER